MNYYYKYLKYKNKYLKTKLMTGSGNLNDACRKYLHPKTNIMPSSVNIEVTSDENDENYRILFDILVNCTECPLILKIGSNDNPYVVSGSVLDELNSGSRGKDGEIFFEITDTPISSTNIIITSDIIKGDVIDKKHSNQVRLLFKKLIEVFNENTKLISVSPTPQYSNFWYPFGIIGEESTESNMYMTFMNSLETTPQYIQGYFPIGINNDSESFNNQILNNLTTRREPLFLFNAMGSTCYQSIKYIIDIRKMYGLPTYYGGLVDDSSDASCEINTSIYPNPEEICRPSEI